MQICPILRLLPATGASSWNWLDLYKGRLLKALFLFKGQVTDKLGQETVTKYLTKRYVSESLADSLYKFLLSPFDSFRHDYYFQLIFSGMRMDLRQEKSSGKAVWSIHKSLRASQISSQIRMSFSDLLSALKYKISMLWLNMKPRCFQIYATFIKSRYLPPFSVFNQPYAIVQSFSDSQSVWKSFSF